MNNRFIKYAFICLIAIGGLLTILAYLGQFDWRLDLLSHFRLQYLFYFSVLLIVAVILKTKVFIATTFIFFVLNLLPFLPYYFPMKASNKESGVVVLSANVQRDNRDFSKVMQLVHKTNPDVIVLEEVTEEWMRELTSLKKSYPYQLIAARNDFFGMALFSKYPLKKQNVKKFNNTESPTLVSDIEVDGKDITIIGIHPVPPFSKWNTELRNDNLEKLSQFINRQQNPVIVVGDMNATIFSYPYRKFVKDTTLANCADGFGYRSTWYHKPYIPPFGLQIDQCFYQAPIKVLDSYVGDDIGSDHKPIVNRISF